MTEEKMMKLVSDIRDLVKGSGICLPCTYRVMSGIMSGILAEMITTGEFQLVGPEEVATMLKEDVIKH